MVNLQIKFLLVLVVVSLAASQETVKEGTKSSSTKWEETTETHQNTDIKDVQSQHYVNVPSNDDTTVDSYRVDEVIESVENRRAYDGLSKTTRYEGEDYETRSPHIERVGVYERPSDPVLGPDHKEERETPTDQLEDKNGSEINQRENKTNITDEPEGLTPPDRQMSGSENHTMFTQEVFINTHVTESVEDTKEIELSGEVETWHTDESDVVRDTYPYDLDLNVDADKTETYAKHNEEIRDKNDAVFLPSLLTNQNLDIGFPGNPPTQITTSNNSAFVETYPEEPTFDIKDTLGMKRSYEFYSEEIQLQPTTPSDITVDKVPINTSFGTTKDEVTTEENYKKIKTDQRADFKQHGQWETVPVAERIYALKFDRNNDEHNSNTLGTIAGSSKDDLYSLPNQHNDESSVHSNYSNSNDLGSNILFEQCADCDLRILPIRPSQQRSTPDIEEESLSTPQIHFADLPEGRELKIYSLGLTDGIYFFSYLGEFLSWIQPNDFPVELLRDALKHQTTWISLILESVQVEAGFVVCLAAVVLLALAVPLVVLSHACYRMGAGDDRDRGDGGGGWAGNCKRRSLVAILQLLLILLFVGMAGMFATNEQLSGAVVRSPDVLQTALSDVSAFVHNAHLHIRFLVIQSLDQTLQAVFADLDNVDSLLGRPIQKELVKETGLDVALETLSDLTREAKSTVSSVDRLLEEARMAQEMVTSSRDKLTDLRQQVELFRRACGPRDRALCDSIDTSGLDVTFKLDRIKLDERLNRMRRMGGVGLELATGEARERFAAVPARVEVDTRDAREGVRRQLRRQREEVDDRSRALEGLARDITAKVNEAKYQAGFWMQHLDEIEYWRWIVCVGGGAAVLMIWTMLLCSLCCGCCGSEKAAGPTILVALVLMCLFSTVLWTVVLFGLLVGGHGEVFLCRPLFDEPDFRAISRLVDEPGVFYDEQRGGFIGNVVYGNDTMDIPIRQVLQDCHANRPVYPTLGLRRVFDVESAIDDHRWAAVDSHLRAVRANLSSLEVLSPALQDQLADLLATISVNFTEHRIQMSRPVTTKDMDSFAKQLDNIGNQMRDLATASRMETLSSRTRRLIESHIRPLEGKKDSLVYQLTALEVQTGPLQRQVNQSLSHLKTIQFFINSQGESIAQRKSREYTSRLQSYVAQLRAHVVEAVTASVAPCRPIWDIFHSARLFLCRHTMDPLNGYWFATTCSLLVLLIATPVCLKLVDCYRQKSCRSSGSPESLVGAEQNAAWSSPGYDIKYSKEHDGECKK